MIKEYETTVSKIIYYDKNKKKKEFLEDFREISVVGSLKSRRLRWAGHVARMEESRNVYRDLVGRPEGENPLGMPRRRWEDNIKMDLKVVGRDTRNWMDLAHYRNQWHSYVRAVMNLQVFKAKDK